MSKFSLFDRPGQRDFRPSQPLAYQLLKNHSAELPTNQQSGHRVHNITPYLLYQPLAYQLLKNHSAELPTNQQSGYRVHHIHTLLTVPASCLPAVKKSQC
jgi:hypothetical protein